MTNTYNLDWSNLQHPVPPWFDDGKFGIYFHWGPYSVPAYSSEWYSHYMYQPGHEANEHHIANYGPLTEFGYKEFIPMFTGEHFDADEWVDLFARAGAKFTGPVAEHAEGFAMWDSTVNPFNAAKMGPKRDIVAEMERATRARGLNFIATLHHMWLWAWFPTWDQSLDTSNPEYEALYGPKTEPGSFEDPQPDEAFCDLFVAKIKEVIDGYGPDLLWFDARLDTISERHRHDFVAYYYEWAAKNGRDVAITHKNEDLPSGVAVLDVERGRMSELRNFKWLTDDSICWDSWADLKTPRYKSVKRLIDGLVDIVSKNGNLLFNITPTADGRIPDGVRERLLGIGDWLNVNGEAIYRTRPWHVYGEGPTLVNEGHFSEKTNADFTAADVRFTQRQEGSESVLYAIIMGWPEDAVQITSLTPELIEGRRIDAVSLLGSDAPINWHQTNAGLTVQFPDERPCDHAYALKIILK